MPLNINLKPFTAHEITFRDAVVLTDTELSPEAIDANFKVNLQRISKYFEENQLALRNVRRQKLGDPGNLRIISDIGFRELGRVVDTGRPFALSSGVPTFQYIPPSNGSVDPRDTPPIICVIHSFGGLFDTETLNKNRNVKSVAVDPLTGFNPARFFAGSRRFLTSNQRVSIHHIVSRRGDIVNSASWDSKAIHGGGPVSRAAQIDVNAVSFGIELEEYFVRHDNERRVNAIENRVPYTEEQYTVIAFILKKYLAWTNNTEILKWLGIGASSVSGVKRGETGLVNHRAFNPNHGDPSAEFLFPRGFVKGDPIPAYFGTQSKKYENRIELFWGDVAAGTPLSAWDRIIDKVARLRSYKLATEVFDASLAGSRIDIQVPQVKNTHVAAAAEAASRDKLNQYERSQRMQGTTRRGLYDRAQIHSAAVGVAFAEHTNRLARATQQAEVKLSVVKNAIGFDFATAQWVTRDTVNTLKTTQEEDDSNG